MSRARPRRAAAAAELALVLPLLALLFVGVVDYCRVYYVSQALMNAARSSALHASGNATDLVTAEQAARSAALAEAVSLEPPLRETDVTVAVTATQATATVRYTFRPLTQFPALPGRIDMEFTVTMPLAP